MQSTFEKSAQFCGDRLLGVNEARDYAATSAAYTLSSAIRSLRFRSSARGPTTRARRLATPVNGLFQNENYTLCDICHMYASFSLSIVSAGFNLTAHASRECSLFDAEVPIFAVQPDFFALIWWKKCHLATFHRIVYLPCVKSCAENGPRVHKVATRISRVSRPDVPDAPSSSRRCNLFIIFTPKPKYIDYFTFHCVAYPLQAVFFLADTA
jgi:hypothetical protein